MPDTAKWYYNGVEHVLAGDAKWPAGSAALYMTLWSAFTPVQATDELYTIGGGITGNANCTELAAANGYTQGGVQLTSVAAPVVYGVTNVSLSSANVTWVSPCTFTGVVAAVIHYAGASNYILGYISYASAKAAQGGQFIIDCPAAGWFEQPVG
jgi:hypothetical protein